MTEIKKVKSLFDPNRYTLGTIATDLMKHGADDVTAAEQAKANLKDFEENMLICINRGKTRFEEDFYIHVETVKDRTLPNSVKNKFIDRRTCPTPFFDQSIYKYHKKDDRIEFLWTLPAKDICEWFYQNPLDIIPEERILLGFILDYYDGTLLKKCKKFNGEFMDTVFLDDGKEHIKGEICLK